MELIEKCTSLSIDQIIVLPDVQERVQLFQEHAALAKQQIQRCSKVYENLVVLDLRKEETIYAVNRFMIYALYPDAQISIHVMWGLKQQNTVFAIGKSIVNRSSPVNIGELCLAYGGGGHRNAGTCQVANEAAGDTLKEIIEKIHTQSLTPVGAGKASYPYSKTKCTTVSSFNRRWCMEQCYKHFDHKERTLIYWWRKEHLSLREIARRLRRSHTSISRELQRNLWCGQHYYPRGAQLIAEGRLHQRAKRARLKSPAVREYVHQKLHLGWTPELIAGRLRHQSELPAVCHESIDQYIDGVTPELIPLLPRHHPKRKRKWPYRKTGERIKNRTSLEARPQAATMRQECGHWEADMLVAGDRTHGLNVLVDRKSRLTHISFLANKTAVITKQAMYRRLKAYPDLLKQSITYDNGSENTLHEELNEALGSTSFFCAPYHSWEKGRVEQMNGLIRRFLPKGTNFTELRHSVFNRIEQLLNNRPRKCLHYRTPYEVFREARGALHG